MLGMEQMYKMALDPRIFPDSRLLAVLQGKDNSLPMAVAMSAKQQRDKLEAANKGQQAQMGAKQPTVRDQMLAKDLPQERAGLDQLPAPTMESMGEPESMAGGGLVSFAAGGMSDDDEELSDQEELDSMMARQGDLGGLGAGIMAVANPKAEMYSAFTKPGISPAAAPGQFKDIAAEAAKKHGASWDLVQHVMHKETGGMKDPAHAVSKAGAQGVMQLMPATAKQLGVTDVTDPNQNINAGVKYLADLERKYKDPKLAAMAYNWGPGNVDKWIKHGKKESAVPKETRMYVASLAQGGVVALAKGGDYTSFGEEAPYDPDAPSISDTIGNMLGSPIERIKNAVSGFGGKSNKEIAAEVAAVQAAKSKPDTSGLQSLVNANTDVNPAPSTNAENQNVPPTVPTAPPGASAATPTPPDANQSMLDKYMANLAQSRKQAPGLALMAAGLGIAGQRSPYALSNIGAGGLQGLQQYAQSQKEDQAGEAAGLSAQAALERNKVYQQHYANAAQQAQALKYDQMIAGLDKTAEDRIKGMTKYSNFDLNNPAQRQQAINAIKYEILSKSPSLKNHYLETSGLDEEGLKKQFMPGLISDTPVGTVRKPT